MNFLFSKGTIGRVQRQDCYCAFCKSPRSVYMKKRMNFSDILAAAFGAVVTMYVVFREFDPRAVLFFVFYMFVADVFVQIRWRVNMICQDCGFDPVLYLKDTAKAVTKVKAHLERRAADPESILKPRLNIPYRRTEEAAAESSTQQSVSLRTKGSRISKQI